MAEINKDVYIDEELIEDELDEEQSIEMNMVRDRALKLPTVTMEMFETCNKDSVAIVKEFFEVHPLLSKETQKQYWSGIKQFLWWVKNTLNDKAFYKISKRDFNRFMSYLINRGMSSSGLKFKRSSVSTICEYIVNIVSEDDEKYEKFHNFTKTGEKIPTTYVYSKIPVSEEEYKILIDTLIEDENYMGACWVACAFNTGARRAGIRGFKTEIIHQEIKEGQAFIKTNTVREKGASDIGKQVSYMLPLPALYYVKLWCEKRGYDHEYIFTTKYKGKIKQVALDWADTLCRDILSDVLKRRINPHLFKSSAISYYLSQGLDLKFVSQNIAMHNDISTTSKFYDLRTFEQEKNDMMAKIKLPETKKID